MAKDFAIVGQSNIEKLDILMNIPTPTPLHPIVAIVDRLSSFLIWVGLPAMALSVLLFFSVPTEYRFSILVICMALFMAHCMNLIYILCNKYFIQEMIPISPENTDDMVIDSNIFEITDDKTHEMALTYYDYFRQEIKREDEITHQRVTWSMTFQGFIVSALTLLLILVWDETRKIAPIGKFSLFAFGGVGILVGYISLLGILSSRRSIDDACREWKDRNDVWKLNPKYVPQAHGLGDAFVGGKRFAVFLPIVFIFMWCLFLCIYTVISYVLWVAPCWDNATFLKCVLMGK